MILLNPKSVNSGMTMFCCVMFILLICTASSVDADIINPSFEIYDPNGGPSFPTALDWDIDQFQGKNVYASDLNALIPVITTQYGGTDNWLIDPIEGLQPKDGERLLVLSTGHPDEPDSPDLNTYAKVWQHFTAEEGERLTGYYFFGTCDYLAQYNDFATITLDPDTPTNPNDDIELIEGGVISVENVGDKGSMAGWELFKYEFTSVTAGEYNLVFYVQDEQDTIVNSYLGIDNLQLCSAPAYGDLNLDCQTNNLDFAIFSEFWTIDCDPNSPGYSDPRDCSYWTGINSPGDFDNDKKVGMIDIGLMLSSWLMGE